MPAAMSNLCYGWVFNLINFEGYSRCAMLSLTQRQVPRIVDYEFCTSVFNMVCSASDTQHTSTDPCPIWAQMKYMKDWLPCFLHSHNHSTLEST